MSRRRNNDEIRDEYRHGAYYGMTEREQLAYQRRDDDWKRKHGKGFCSDLAEFFLGKPSADLYKDR